MRTFTSRWRRSTPVPRQVGQGSSTTTPLPWQLGHGWLKENRPWLSSTTPRPWQMGQVCGVVPGRAPLPWQVEQAASEVRYSVVLTPLTASAKDMLSSASRSPPRRGPTPLAAPPPRRRPRPKRFPRRSPASPPSKVNEKPWSPPRGPPAPPGPNMPPMGPSLRTSSYSLRLASSPTTSYAAEISLKRSSALVSPGLASGCDWRASLRYALVMSLGDAESETPSTL